MEQRVRFRWLGVAGLEFVASGETLLIDPFVSRPPLHRVLFGRAEPEAALVARHVPRADAVLATHPHWDHLMDVPAVIRRTGAVAYGSPNTCKLLRALGIAEERVRQVGAGDQMALGAFAVEVLPAEHLRICGRTVLAGAVPDGLRAPLRLRDYRMDCDFSFLVTAGGLRLLDWSSATAEGAPRADVLFVKPFGAERASYVELLRAVRPRVVVPIHWDDFFCPLSRPLRASFAPPAWGWRPLRRADLEAFRRATERVMPGVRVFLPDIFHSYELRSGRAGTDEN